MCERFFICRVVFKSQVKPLLRARAFIQPREDMKIKTDQTVRWISIFGYLMTSLKMASRFHREESIFNSCLRPSRFSPLYLSHESKRDGKVSTEERIVVNNNGVVRFRAAKYSQKVLSTVVLEIPLKWNCL